ncbi:hypothetical protein [Streptomyces sp. NBC_00887]|uniref:hypothetical protein n=1 Tax=Streptomyces sp. NBC_00887 TaxID=2975859 RepID=UPI00386A6AA4|nr:hypothetical protein OG844_00260 [Streptomyces sp. NBC_00887]WSY36361.1 hypothetical protein OG844_45340 [Streptomyces sp. NBC_00887]
MALIDAEDFTALVDGNVFQDISVADGPKTAVCAAPPISDSPAPAPATPTEPSFTALTAHWAAAGRVVPGRTDREWAIVAGSCPWPQ